MAAAARSSASGFPILYADTMPYWREPHLELRVRRVPSYNPDRPLDIRDTGDYLPSGFPGERAANQLDEFRGVQAELSGHSRDSRGRQIMFGAM